MKRSAQCGLRALAPPAALSCDHMTVGHVSTIPARPTHLAWQMEPTFHRSPMSDSSTLSPARNPWPILYFRMHES